MRRARWFFLCILIAVGVGLLGALIYLSGPRLVLNEFRAIKFFGAVVVMGNVFLSLLTWIMSWGILLRAAGVSISWSHLAGAFLSGYAITYFTPSMYLGGEPVRAYLVAKQGKIPMTTVIATIVVERLLAGLCFIGLATVGGFFAIVSTQLSVADKWAVAVGLVVVASFLVLGILSFARNWRWISRLLNFFAKVMPGCRGLMQAAAKVAETEHTAYLAFTEHLPSTILALVCSFFTVALEYLRPQMFFYLTQKTLFSMAQLSLYFTLNAFLGAFLWITPGGVGTAEGGRMAIFALFGITPSQALVFSITFRLFELVAVGVGFYYLAHWGILRLRRARIAMKKPLATDDLSQESREDD